MPDDGMATIMQITDSRVAEAVALFGTERQHEAVQVLKRSAGEGQAEALFFLGDCYWTGTGVDQDFARGRELFRQSSERGCPQAVFAYTNLLASGIAGLRDWQGALRRLRNEAQSDMLRAMMLGLIEKMAIDENGDPVSPVRGERLSEAPLAVLFRDAFSDAECDFLIRIAEPTFQPSLVSAANNGGDVRDTIRTSDGSTIHWIIEDPATHAINRRIAALSGTRVNQGEPIQILRYRPGQQYRLHVDWLGTEKARILTGLVYLNSDYQGGETEFPKAKLKIRGHKGDALVFRSVGPDGLLDKMSEHAGLPVTQGTKYLASRWIRAHRHSA